MRLFGWSDIHKAWVQGVGIVGIFLAVFYGIKKMLQAREWYLDFFFDHRVREFLHSHHTTLTPVNGSETKSFSPKTVQEIAKGIGMSEKRVQACLTRLSRKNLVSVEASGWKAKSN